MHDKCNEYFNLIPIHLTGDFAGARIAVKKAFDLDRKFRAKFVEDDDFDGVWDSFGEDWVAKGASKGRWTENLAMRIFGKA